MTWCRGCIFRKVNKSRWLGVWSTWWCVSWGTPATAKQRLIRHRGCKRGGANRGGVTPEGNTEGWPFPEDGREGETVDGAGLRPPEPGQEPLGLDPTNRSVGKRLGLELPKESSLQPQEGGGWGDWAGELFFCMVLFLCFEETLAVLKRSVKSAKIAFILGGVEVGEGEIKPCWTKEQLRDWTLGVHEADAWRLVWSQKSP